MRQGTYLNVILTVNALLLAVLAWTQLGSSTPLVQQATAQSSGGSMVNAADQRQRMIEALRDMRSAAHETNRLLERGTIKTHVVNAAELRRDAESDEAVDARH